MLTGIIKISLVIVILGPVVSASQFYQSSIEGKVVQIEFDSDLNSYVISRSPNNSETFYKLNSKNEYIQVETFKKILKLIVTANNDVYIFEKSNENEARIWKRKWNSLIFKIIYNYRIRERNFSNPNVIFADHEDNMFFNTIHGVEMLRHNSKFPQGIVNLNNFYIKDDKNYLIDKRGNIILSGFDSHKVNTFAVITRDEICRAIPTALKLSNHPDLASLKSIVKDYGGKIYFVHENPAKVFRSHIFDKRGHIYKNSNGDLNIYNEPLLSQSYYQYSNFFISKNRLYLTALNIYKKNDDMKPCYLFYIEEGEPGFINDIFNDTLCEPNPNYFSSDNFGKFYYGDYETNKIYVVQNGVLSNLQFAANYPISAISVDHNDNLIVLAGNLYLLKKDGCEFVKLTDEPITDFSLIKIKKKTNEVFIGTQNGLYVHCNPDLACENR